MDIYVLSSTKDFTKSQLERLDSFGKVYFLETPQDIGKVFVSKRPKIVAINPAVSGYKIDAEFLGKIKELKAICLFTTTMHYVDLNYCRRNGIVVRNTANYAGEAIAEYLIFLALCCLKKLPLQIKYGKQEFSNMFIQRQLRGKVAGIIGLGDVGSKVAATCKNMGMRVVYWSKENRDTNYRFAEFEDIFAFSDVVFLTLANNRQTEGLVKEEHLLKLKKTAVFVTSSGTYLHNHQLVLDLVRKGRLFGYGLEEKDKTIMDYQGNVMVTSEYDWFTHESQTMRVDIWIDNIEKSLAHR